MQGAKTFEISKQLVMEAYQRVRANRGASGIDEVSIAAFEKNVKGNLYKIRNRMSSGCYMPPAVKLVEIPKSSGGKRSLGIPTVGDRVAQMIVVQEIRKYVSPLPELKLFKEIVISVFKSKTNIQRTEAKQLSIQLEEAHKKLSKARDLLLAKTLKQTTTEQLNQKQKKK